MEKCIPGKLYLIGADEKNHIYTFNQALDLLISMSTYKGKISKVIDQEFVRPTAVPRLIGDTRPFRQLTGWKPKIPFVKILKDTLNYWREFVQDDWY